MIGTSSLDLAVLRNADNSIPESTEQKASTWWRRLSLSCLKGSFGSASNSLGCNRTNTQDTKRRKLRRVPSRRKTRTDPAVAIDADGQLHAESGGILVMGSAAVTGAIHAN